VTQERMVAYTAIALALAVAVTMVVKGDYGPASVMVAGAAFLVYWARRQDGRGER
jgi:cell division protein FtsW (lipid II flippase)